MSVRNFLSYVNVALCQVLTFSREAMPADWRALYSDIGKIKSFEIKEYWREPYSPDRAYRDVADLPRSGNSEWEQNLSFWFGVYDRCQRGFVSDTYRHNLIVLSQTNFSSSLGPQYGAIGLYLLRDLKSFFVCCESEDARRQRISEFYEVQAIKKSSSGLVVKASHFHEPRCEFVIAFYKESVSDWKRFWGVKQDYAQYLKIPVRPKCDLSALDVSSSAKDKDAERRFEALKNWTESYALERENFAMPSESEIKNLALYDPVSQGELNYLRTLGLISYDTGRHFRSIDLVLQSCRRRKDIGWYVD